MKHETGSGLSARQAPYRQSVFRIQTGDLDKYGKRAFTFLYRQQETSPRHRLHRGHLAALRHPEDAVGHLLGAGGGLWHRRAGGGDAGLRGPDGGFHPGRLRPHGPALHDHRPGHGEHVPGGQDQGLWEDHEGGHGGAGEEVPHRGYRGAAQ